MIYTPETVTLKWDVYQTLLQRAEYADSVELPPIALRQMPDGTFHMLISKFYEAHTFGVVDMTDVIARQISAVELVDGDMNTLAMYARKRG